MTRMWQRAVAVLAILWPALRYFGVERPFLIPRYPIAPILPAWIDWLLDLPLIVAMIAIGLTVAPRRALLLVLIISFGQTMLIAAMGRSELPYYSAEGFGEPRLVLVSLAYGCIYLGVPTAAGALARCFGIGASGQRGADPRRSAA
jgi:hypothetical protein